MPRRPDVRSAAYADALSAVERWVEENCPSANALEDSQLNAYRSRNIVAGWSIAVQFADGEHQLHLLLDQHFPRTIPQVAMVDHPPPSTWPHVQEQGVLCLVPDSAVVDSSDPVGIVSHVFGQACQLIEELIAGQRQEDFQDEFLPYWSRAAEKETRVLSLVEPKGPSRAISVWRGTDFCLVADNEGDAKKWLSNYSRGKKSDANIEQGCLLWLPEPLFPKQYPRTPDDILALARAAGAPEILQTAAGTHPGRLMVVLGMDSKNGPCFGAVSVEVPQDDKVHRNDKRTVLDRGFRVGKTPPKVISTRFFAGSGVSRMCVERVDASWVHGRGQDSRSQKLREMTVTVLGCGSVGSEVASMLAQVGVGNLILVDPETLSAANTGRHSLGSQALGCCKAESLATRLKADFPHINSIQAYNAAWEDMPLGTANLLDSSDLIVSTIGKWSAEAELNEWHLRGGRARPIVYGWTEPYACSGHAVSIFSKGGCLQCGFALSGTPKLQVAVFGRNTLLAEPACGVLYQPYSMIELMHTVVLITELAIDCLLGQVHESEHRVWAGRLSLVKNLGGKWTDEWLRIANGRIEGGFVEEQKWNISTDCRECQKMKVQLSSE